MKVMDITQGGRFGFTAPDELSWCEGGTVVGEVCGRVEEEGVVAGGEVRGTIESGDGAEIGILKAVSTRRLGGGMEGELVSQSRARESRVVCQVPIPHILRYC
jgi:hypothetical protein